MILWRCIYLNNSKDCWRSLAVLIACASLLRPVPMLADPIAVRYTEGLIHGFLVLRTPAGETLAAGDLIQVAHGGQVTTRLIFHFKDGSPHEETAVHSQHPHLPLLSGPLLPKRPTVPPPMEGPIHVSTGRR